MGRGTEAIWYARNPDIEVGRVSSSLLQRDFT
jgi:hypothetical protein